MEGILEGAMRVIRELYPEPGESSEAASFKAALWERIALDGREEAKAGLLAALRKAVPGYAVVDFAEEDALGVELHVLMHEGQEPLDYDRELLSALGGDQLALYVFVSRAAPYCCMYCVRTIHIEYGDTWIFDTIAPPPGKENVFEAVEGCLLGLGYERIPFRIAAENVPWVSLDLVPKGEATVFNCLFTDLRTLSLVPVVHSAFGEPE